MALAYGILNLLKRDIMSTTNPLIECMELVRFKAATLDCTVIAVLNNVILCRRSDGTYITWRASMYCTAVEFISGCYDMTVTRGYEDLIDRAGDTSC